MLGTGVHELSLAENLRQIIETQAKRQGFTRVQQVVLAVGKLSCVEPSALAFCFASVMAGSPAEQADLKIVQIAGRGRCPKCENEWEIDELCDLCPNCQEVLEVVAGLELHLKELVVE